ncbi:MAG: TIM barrel protein [Lentisphaerae bacterium]|nr:TIM barrel protein [Lentisphaerota bacterium]
MNRRRFLAGAGALPLAWTGFAPAHAGAVVGDDERRRIEAALPAEAPARPSKPRRLLIFDLNVNYGGHRSAAHASLACELMGRKTGAFETVVSSDPAVFAPESLKGFDAVFFNNNVGNLFEDPALRRSLVEFVLGGGGLMGVHGTSVAFTRWPGAVEDWPEFGRMLGARGAAHMPGNGEERAVLKLDDPDHPLNRPFGGKGFEHRSEFFRFGDPFSRNRVRVLMSLDNAASETLQGAPLKAFRKDGDYAVAWVRHYGRGRVFYSSIAHHPDPFWDPTMLKFYLGAAQFALGDLPAPTIPSARLTPAIRAQEALGWRLGVEAYTFHKFTLFEAAEKTSRLGLPFMGGLSFQKVSAAMPKNLDPALSDDEIRDVRLKLDDEGVRMLTYYIGDIPGDEAGCRRVFEFGRKLGIETFMSEPKPEALDTIARCCDEYGINVAIHNHDAKGSPNYWKPELVLRACEGRTPRLGACADLGYWMRSGIDPIEGLRTLGKRLITVQVHDLHELTPQGHDVPWGTGAGRTAEFLREMHRLGVRPTMIGLEYSYNWLESLPDIARCVEFVNTLGLQLAGGRAS